MKRFPLSFSIVLILFFSILSCEQEPVVQKEEPVENDGSSITVTSDALNITYESADLYGYANLTPGSGDVKIGILYSTNETPTSENGVELITKELDSKNKFKITVTGLSPGTTYYYCSFVIQGGIRFKGNIKSFTTQSIGIHLRGGNISNITCYSAIIRGNITFDEGIDHTKYNYGVCYDIIKEPTIKSKCIPTDQIDSEGNYVNQLCGLSGSTTYYYRLYATVDSIVKYSDVKSFKTEADESVITTGSIDFITNEVKSKFELGDGVYSHYLLGVCYGKNETPTIDDRIETAEEVDDEDCLYTVHLQQIYSQTTYYYRAFVVIDDVPHYGAIIKFTKEKQIGLPVDLGLSVKWGSFNVDADFPEDYGNYYAWGEIEPKEDYSWATYKWCNGSSSTLSKYNSRVRYGTVDKKSNLDLEDDVAYVKWGDNWHIPTQAELEELRNNCIWTWTSVNGVYGYKITSNVNGYTDNSIFLPAAGYYVNKELYALGSSCEYYSSSLLIDNPSDIYIIESNENSINYNNRGRNEGRTVRPVCQSEAWLSNLSITISDESLNMYVNTKDTLTISAINKGQNVDYLIIDKIQWSSSDPSIATVDENGIVTAISSGAAIIIASYYDKTVECKVTTEHEYVDLGLSVKWATENIGATYSSKYGNYYAWGEVETKSAYTTDTYKWGWHDSASNRKISKYNCTNTNQASVVDNKSTLDPEDDIAHVMWQGKWRMPTREEMEELINNCYWKWTGGGFKVTSKKDGYQDKSIFLPAAGWYGYTSTGYGTAMVPGHGGEGEGCYYWSSSLGESGCLKAYLLQRTKDKDLSGDSPRYGGYSVRPVCP